MQRRTSSILSILLGTLFMLPILGQAGQTCSGEHCVAVGNWDLGVSLGIGIRSNPVENGDEVPLIVLPSIAWHGKRFWLQNLDFGFTLFDAGQSQANLLVTPSFDRLYFERSDSRNFFLDADFSSPLDSVGESTSGLSPEADPGPGSEPEQENLLTPAATENPLPPASDKKPSLDDRDLAILGGIEYSFWRGPNTWQLQLLHDITGTHNGAEVRGSWHDRHPNRRVNVIASRQLNNRRAVLTVK